VLHGDILWAASGPWTIAVPTVIAAVCVVGRQHIVHFPPLVLLASPTSALLRGAAVSIHDLVPGFNVSFFDQLNPLFSFKWFSGCRVVIELFFVTRRPAGVAHPRRTLRLPPLLLALRTAPPRLPSPPPSFSLAASYRGGATN